MKHLTRLTIIALLCVITSIFADNAIVEKEAQIFGSDAYIAEAAPKEEAEEEAEEQEPLSHYERCLKMIRAQCDEAGIPEYYTMVAAISRLETGNFTSNLFVKHNNWGGMKENGKFASYESNFEGLHRYITMMKSKIRKYGDNVEAMQKHYCPGSDTWAPKVRRIMKELEED